MSTNKTFLKNFQKGSSSNSQNNKNIQEDLHLLHLKRNQGPQILHLQRKK